MQYILCISILFFISTTSLSQNYSLEIFAKDLSEDATVMSSKNDELVLLIYKLQNESMELNSPAFVTSFDLDTLNRSKTLKDVTLNNQHYILFLIENDDNRTVQQIDPVIRVYWRTILSLINEKKYTELTTYLGDNDLLGYSKFNLNGQEITLEIRGRQSLDTFHYLIKVK